MMPARSRKYARAEGYMDGATDMEKLAEISRLLDEAYKHYFTFGDGGHKSSEGYLSVDFGLFWDREQDPTNLAIKGVHIYSYIFGPGRSHDFDSLDDAMREVLDWHHNEMNHDYSESGWA